MVVTCDQCGSRYKLADHKITGRGAKITCPSCRHVFVVYRDAASSTTGSGGASSSGSGKSGVGERVELPLPPKLSVAQPSSTGGGGFSVTFVEGSAAVESRPVEDLRADKLDYAKVGIQAWKVKVRIGLVYDFNDLGTLRKYIADGRVTEQDLLSHDGQSWVSIGDIPDLEAHFVGIYRAARDAMMAPVAEPGGGKDRSEDTETPLPDDFSEEIPTNIVGMGDIGSGLAKGALASPPEAASLETSRSSAKSSRKAASEPASAPASTGNAEAQGPRFVDPFEAMRAEKRQTAGRRRKKGGGAAGGLADGGSGAASRVPRSGPPDVRPSESKKGGKGALVAAALVILALVGGGALYASGMLSPAPKVSNPRPPDPLADASKPEQQGQDEATNELLERVKNIPVEEAEKPSWEVEEEPVLQAVVPAEFQGGRKAGSGSKGSTPSSATAVEAHATTSSEHGAAGDAFLAQGDAKMAITAYSQAVKMDPSNPVWQEKLGVAQWRSGDSQAAKVTLSQASRSGALAADKYLGHIARDQGDVAGAVARYNDYLKSNPSDAAEIKRQIAALTQG